MTGLWTINLLYLVDVHVATVGYILTLKPLDAHIRTANPYGMAWVAALICYPPFILMNGGPLAYQIGGSDWGHWFAGPDILMALGSERRRDGKGGVSTLSTRGSPLYT